jgi:hypothetical protein
MKRYDDLTESKKAEAIERCIVKGIRFVMDGGRLDDAANGNDLRARMDAAMKKAEDMKTPWYAVAYMMDDEVLKRHFMLLGKSVAESAYYPEHGELVVYL